MMEETAGSLALAVPYQYGQFVSPWHCSRSCVTGRFRRDPHKNATSRLRFRTRLCKTLWRRPQRRYAIDSFHKRSTL